MKRRGQLKSWKERVVNFYRIVKKSTKIPRSRVWSACNQRRDRARHGDAVTPKKFKISDRRDDALDPAPYALLAELGNPYLDL